MAREAFTGVHLTYLPGTPESQTYGAVREGMAATYLAAIVAPPEELRALLGEGFLHIDGAVTVDEQTATVTNVSVIEGRDDFVDGFRPMVNAQSEPDGDITGVWLGEAAYAPLAAQVDEQLAHLLPQGFQLGRLVAAAVVEFPYKLRNDPNAPAFEIPPPLQGLIRHPEEDYMLEPLRALDISGQPELDKHTVRAIQAIYADDEGKVTARVGLVWNDDRGVPFAIHEEMTAVREGKTYRPQTAVAIAELLTRQAS